MNLEPSATCSVNSIDLVIRLFFLLGSVTCTVDTFHISELKMKSNGAYEASQSKWISCLHTCPSVEQHAASGIQRDGEMSPKPPVPCLNLVSALCLDKVYLDWR